MGRRRPGTNPLTSTRKPSPSSTTDHRRRLMRFGKTHRKGNQIAASGRRKLIAVHQAGKHLARMQLVVFDILHRCRHRRYECHARKRLRRFRKAQMHRVFPSREWSLPRRIGGVRIDHDRLLAALPFCNQEELPQLTRRVDTRSQMAVGQTPKLAHRWQSAFLAGGSARPLARRRRMRCLHPLPARGCDRRMVGQGVGRGLPRHS